MSGRKWLWSIQKHIHYKTEILCLLGGNLCPYATKGCQQGTLIALLTFGLQNRSVDLSKKGLMQAIFKMAKRRLTLLLMIFLMKEPMLMQQVMMNLEQEMRSLDPFSLMSCYKEQSTTSTPQNPPPEDPIAQLIGSSMQQSQQQHQHWVQMQMQTQTNLMIAFLGVMNPNALQLFQQLPAQSPSPQAQSLAPA